MAKVTGPLYSQTARGFLAPSVFFSTNGGKPTARTFRKASNPKTANQTYTRDKMAVCVEEWQQMPKIDRESYGSKDLPPYQDFISKRMKETMNQLRYNSDTATLRNEELIPGLKKPSLVLSESVGLSQTGETVCIHKVTTNNMVFSAIVQEGYEDSVNDQWSMTQGKNVDSRAIYVDAIYYQINILSSVVQDNLGPACIYLGAAPGQTLDLLLLLGGDQATTSGITANAHYYGPFNLTDYSLIANPIEGTMGWDTVGKTPVVFKDAYWYPILLGVHL